MTVVVTVGPLRRSTDSIGSWLSCLMPSEIRSFSTSTSSTLGLDHVALGVLRDGFFARRVPVDVGEVDHAVDVRAEADEQAELGDVPDFAFDVGPTGCSATKASHGLSMTCFRPSEMRRFSASTSSTTTSTSCEVETILPGWTFFLVQLISRDVDQAFDAGFQFNERAVVGDVGDAAGELGAHRVFRFNAIPRIGLQLLHAERDALGVRVDLDDLDFDSWPTASTWLGCETRFQLMSVTCSRPSMPPRSTNAP